MLRRKVAENLFLSSSCAFLPRQLIYSYSVFIVCGKSSFCEGGGSREGGKFVSVLLLFGVKLESGL